MSGHTFLPLRATLGAVPVQTGAVAFALLLLAAGCGTMQTTEDAAPQPVTDQTGDPTLETSPEDWTLSGSPLRRIGPGRAVAADAAAGVNLIATTTGVELYRDQQVMALPVTTLEPPTEVGLTPDGAHGIIERDAGIEIWELGPEPRSTALAPAGLSWALADDGTALIVSDERLALVDPASGSSEEIVVPDGRVFGEVAVAADGAWWFATMQGGETLEALVSASGVPGGGDGASSVSLDLPGQTIVEQAVPDPSGDRVVLDLLDQSSGLERQLVLWDLDADRALWSVSLLTDDVWDIGPDGAVMIVGPTTGRLIAADGQVTELGSVNDGSPPFSLHALASDRFVVVMRDGGRIVIGGDGTVVDVVPGSDRSVTVTATDADGAGASVVYFLGAVDLVDNAGLDGRSLDRYTAGLINDVEIAGDDTLAIATSTGTVTLLPVDGGSDDDPSGGSVELRHDEGDVQSVAFSPDGTRLLTGLGERFSENTYDDTVTLWDATSQERLVEIGGEGEEVLGCSSFTNAVRYASNGSFVVGISHDFTVSFFDAETFALIRTVSAHEGPILGVALSPDDTRLITTSQEDLSMRVWDTESGELIVEHQAPPGGYRSVEYLPDGSGVLVSELSGQLSIVDPDTGASVRTFESVLSIGGQATVSPDGRYVAAGHGPVARLWSTETGQVVGELNGHSGFVTSTAFSEDGARLVTGATDGTAVVWDLQDV